ncbi:MAG: cation:proton antiporter [Thermoplasmata archaeon]|nr:cation:proton antiporter [Thermoplasmata archaeon]
MISTYLLLIALAVIILLGYLSDALFRMTRIPEILILLLIGIILVPVGHIIPEKYTTVLRDFVPLFGSIALIMIMFDGGRKIDFEATVSGSGKGLILAVLDVSFSMIFISLLMHYIFYWPFIYGAILGTIIGETTAVVIVPVATRIKIPNALYNMAITEATFNSVVDILLFYLLLVLFSGSTFVVSSYTKYAVDYLSVAVFLGLIVGFLWLFTLNILKGAKGYVATLGIAFLLYGVVDYLGGAAVFAIFIFAIIIGNYKTIGKHLNLKIDIHENEMSIVENELEFIVRTFFFVFIGMIAIISISYFVYALIITVILVLIRIAEVKLVVKEREYQGFMVSLLPRGLTVAVLASLLLSMGGSYFSDIFYISFMIIIITNVIAGITISISAKSIEKLQ